MSCCQEIKQYFYFRYQVLESGTIEISDVRTADSGMYQCFAGNDAGEVNAATWLKILSKSNTLLFVVQLIHRFLIKDLKITMLFI